MPTRGIYSDVTLPYLTLCCPRAFATCWLGEAYTQKLILIKFILRLFGCMSLDFIARGGVGETLLKRVIRQMPFLCLCDIYPSNIPPPLATPSSEWTRLPARVPGGGSTRQRCHSD
jgi:hypothetical protein